MSKYVLEEHYGGGRIVKTPVSQKSELGLLIGDTKEQLECGLPMDGKVYRYSDIKEMEAKIKALQQELNNRPSPWISVEDRLPEFHKQILFYAGDIDGLMKGAFYQHSHRFQNNNGDFFYKSDVTHWMPLPEPPTQEQGE